LNSAIREPKQKRRSRCQILQVSGKILAQVGIFYPVVQIIFLLFLLEYPTFMWKSRTKWGFVNGLLSCAPIRGSAAGQSVQTPGLG
jgi:hypothetical protein